MSKKNEVPSETLSIPMDSELVAEIDRIRAATSGPLDIEVPRTKIVRALLRLGVAEYHRLKASGSGA